MAGGLDRIHIDPISLADVPVETDATTPYWQINWPEGTERQVLARDGNMVGGDTKILKFPPGYGRPLEVEYEKNYSPGRFEQHTCHEEVWVLEGLLHFGPYYDIVARGYKNHPPGWLHPAHQTTQESVTLLIKNSAEVDFIYEDIPPDWDGTECFAESQLPCPSKGVTNVRLDSLPWEPVLDQAGNESGLDARHIWDDEVRGWTTWMMRVPAGWQGQGQGQVMAGGDEMLILEGDLWTDRGNGPVHLVGSNSYSDPEHFVDGGSAERSESGCVAIRWTKGAEHLMLPPIRD